jgi:hypothetical protein
MAKNYRAIWIKANGPIPKDKEGRPYEIHHIDGDRSNNDLANLMCISIQEHFDIHYSQGDWVACNLIQDRMSVSVEVRAEVIRKMAEKKRGVPNLKASLALKGKKRQPHSQETKDKIRQSNLNKVISEETRAKMSHSRKSRGLTAWNKGNKSSKLYKSPELFVDLYNDNYSITDIVKQYQVNDRLLSKLLRTDPRSKAYGLDYLPKPKRSLLKKFS